MHFYNCAGINSQSFTGAGGSGHTHCGSGWECNTHVAGAGGNGQKFSGSGMKKTVLCRALVCSDWLSRKLATSAQYAPQHLLTPLCHFTWPTTPWLSWLDLLHSWHPITVPHWNSLSSWEQPILSHIFVEAVCMPRCLNLYTCGHGSDWNPWI